MLLSNKYFGFFSEGSIHIEAVIVAERTEDTIATLSTELDNIRNGKQTIYFDGNNYTAQEMVVQNDICE